MAEIIPFSTAGSADALDDAVQAYFLKDTADRKTYYNQYYYVENGIDTRVMKDSGMSGFSKAKRVTENAVIKAESPIQTYSQTYTQYEIGLMGKFTKQMWKFGIQKRDVEKVVKGLNDAVYRLRETDCADRLNNSFSTTFTDGDGNSVSCAGGDSAALISASHTREDGGTAWNNRITDGTTVNMDCKKELVFA